jgi:hypothetical protein
MYDTFLRHFLEEKLAADRERAMRVIMEMRAWRQRRNGRPEAPEGHAG